MPLPTPLKELAHGEQNATSAPRRQAISDAELQRKQREAYIHSKDMVDNSGYMTARVISVEKKKNPFSWSVSAAESREDVELVVVTAHLIEKTCSPSYDEPIYAIDDPSNPLHPNTVAALQYKFVAVSQLPMPSPGDDVWVDFENRKTHTGPRYHGIKNSNITSAGTEIVNNPDIAGTSAAKASAAPNNKGAASAALAKPVKGVNVPVSPFDSSRDIDVNKDIGKVKETSVFSLKPSRDINNDGVLEKHAGNDIGVPMYTPIYSIYSGRISLVVENPPDHGAAGIEIVINHDITPEGQSIDRKTIPSYRTRYLHLSQTYVKPGDYVMKGQFIGRSGTAGTGPHLHLEVYDAKLIGVADSAGKHSPTSGLRSATKEEESASINGTVITRAEQIALEKQQEEEKLRTSLKKQIIDLVEKIDNSLQNLRFSEAEINSKKLKSLLTKNQKILSILTLDETDIENSTEVNNAITAIKKVENALEEEKQRVNASRTTRR